MQKTEKYLLFKARYLDELSHDTYEKGVKYGVKFEDESFYFTSSKPSIGIPKALECQLYDIGYVQKDRYENKPI